MAKPLYIWLLEQDIVGGWDTYDSCVVVAATENDAQRIHPSEFADAWSEERGLWVATRADGELAPAGNDTWCRPEQVTAIKVGSAVGDSEAGDVLCASFNAG